MKLQMQPNPHSLARTNLQEQIAVMHVERLAFWESLSSATRHVCRKWIALLDDRRKQKWIWVILLALAAYESYFVRALLAALFFLTILYVVLAPLPALYSFIAHAFYCGILWTAMGRRLIPFFAATPSYIVCPSTGPARTSTECSGR